jgi:NTE family protein
MQARLIALAALATTAGCATPHVAAPIDIAPTPRAAHAGEPDGLGVEGDAVALAFSGGGARAAAFSLGVLEGLRDMRAPDGRSLLERVVFVTAVSGGAITAAYFGQQGPDGLDGFRPSYLDQDVVRRLHTSPASPANWLRALRGGLNDSDRMADLLDQNIFRGGVIGDIWARGRPRVWINATDLFNGASFAFTTTYFDALCSDLGSMRIADAVAASMAVPLAFHPVAIATHPDKCLSALPAWTGAAAHDRGRSELLHAAARAFESYRDPERMQFVHLVDGGVSDNLGLTSILTVNAASADGLAPLSVRDAVRARRIAFLVVNAEQGRSAKWPRLAAGPNGVEAGAAALDDAMDASKRASYDAFRAMVAGLQERVRAYRCALPAAEVARLRGALDGWSCGDVNFTVDMISFSQLDPALGDKLGVAPTTVSLPRETIDALIEGGRRGVADTPSAQSLTH